MTSRTQATRRPERVAAWPRVSATVRPDGTGTLTINGTARLCAAPSVDELRTGMIARCTRLAGRLRRPVRLTVVDGAASWILAVSADGVVQLVDASNTIAPVGGLAPHEGRCRVCLRLQPVTAANCSQCGVDEPHLVEAEPVDVRDVVPDADAVDTLEHAETAPPPSARARVRRPLRLTFPGQPCIEVTGDVALGRKPDPVGGRQPVQITSPERMVSRTHAFVDVDDAGRIIVTDNHASNGVEAQTAPRVVLTPGKPHVIQPGTTLLLGDVVVRLDFV